MIGAKVTVNRDDEQTDALKQGVSEALRDAADKGFEESQRKVAHNSTDTGMLLRSGVQPTIRADGSVEWGYTAPHAPFVEFGTAPHWPPIQPLKDWARRVLGDESAAYAVQKKIAQQGTQPEPFFRPGIETMRRALKAQNVRGFVEDNL